MGKEHHLLGEDLVAEQVASEKRGVLIREIEGFVQGNIGVAAQVLMHEVVLSGRVVQVRAGVTVGTVLAHQGLQVMHGEELFVLVRGRVEENTEVDIDHFVVTHEERGRREIGLVHIVLGGVGGGEREGGGRFHDFLVVDLPADGKHGVAGRVVLLHEILDGGLRNVGQVFTDAQDGLAHEVVSV